jgi:non-ribosomal peptide synthetase-like protein
MTGGARPRTILDEFDRACATRPDAAALEIPATGARLTYAEIDAMANAFAAEIVPRVRPDAVVALALPRTDPWLFAGMLGAMRAGAAYAAIDPAFPARQAAEIMRDAEAVAIACTGPRHAEIAAAGAVAPRIDCATLAPCASFARPPVDPASLAYVIYTSGTTGKPKGVEIEHRSIRNLVTGDLAEFGLGPDDRVVQGSSASYDSSIEELWLAWAAGATAVVLDDETARLGPDLLPWLQRERITVFCPPPTLLRTLGTSDPARDLPRIRMVYVGGEALPGDIACQWSRGRRLENGYGPTECTVTCLRATVRAGEPVTIGRAIPGSFAAVVDPDDAELREIADESHGELVVGGASLARGYRGQPETTAARFIEHPTLGRVYRTGDLVHRDRAGDFHYHGRIDAQVKLRGYRVELGAVEARLAAHPGVLEAACTVEGEGSQRRLVAHVVARRADSFDAGALRAFVAEALPAYMVPAAIAPIDALPRSVGGKLDRKRLPSVGDAAPEAIVAPTNALERAVAEALAAALGRPAGSISIDADLFDDLGLDSLTAAIAISRLRSDDATKSATVRLAYQHRTVRAVAEQLAARHADGTRETRAATLPQGIPQGIPRPLAATIAQTAFLATMLVAGTQALWIPSFSDAVLRAIERPVAGFLAFALIAAGVYASYTAGMIALALAAKWIIIGRYRPARVRAWSAWHVRHWIVVRLATLVPWNTLGATGLTPALLRLFGARIGHGVHIHRGVRVNEGGWDLLALEDGATVGQDACLRLVELDAGCLVVGPITVRRGGTLETRAGMSPGAELGEGSVLTPLSNLEPGTVERHAMLDGVPAIRTGDAPRSPPPMPSSRHATQVGVACLLQLVMVALLALPWLGALALCGLTDGPIHEKVFPADGRLPAAGLVARLAGAVVLAGILTVFLEALLVRALGSAPRGRYALGSFAATRMSMQSALVEAAGKWLSGTIMWPMWLNLAGARIGRGCEISTVIDVIPSTVSIGEETFFADGIYLGGPRVRAGTAEVEPVRLGRSCFVGNHAVLPAGTHLADGTLVGISTRADLVPHEAGSSWFGHPPFRLPRREIVEMPRELTHDPPLVRRVNRWIWELARFALPIGPVFVGLVWFRSAELAEAALDPWTFRLVALPLCTLGAFAALAGAILAMKWLLVARVKPGTHALWSCWCSRWDFLYVAWGMWASVPLGFIDGTLLLVGYLRAMGCRIGRRALLGHGFTHVVDPDMLRFGDDVTVDALFQAHTFEDRVLKVDHVDLRDGCTVRSNTVVLYGADIGAGASVAAHSVVMKRELLAPGGRYGGAPTQPA